MDSKPADIKVPEVKKKATAAKISRSNTPARAKPEPKNKKEQAKEPAKSKEITKKH